ncbi:MAG: aldose epimerase [Gemmatimonadetes bacterium]|nr:aldose epimerase [Gemmatimonadota bacterium]
MTSPVVTLRSADGASIAAHHDGAHVVSWRPAGDGDERLFLSARTVLREGVAIRGGIPVIFPQFAAEGPLPRHGFARTMRWTLAGVDEPATGDASVRFSLVDSEATRLVWPVTFAATITARVGGARLAVSLAVRNTGDTVIDFSVALHTYLHVADVASVELEGLRGCRFRESSAPGVLRIDDESVLRPTGEVDRVYVDVPRPLLLREPGRALGISATGFPDVVVWNPGAAKAAKLDDMEPGGERRMLCVEAAAVQRRVVVAPGETWTGTQVLEAR